MVLHERVSCPDWVGLRAQGPTGSGCCRSRVGRGVSRTRFADEGACEGGGKTDTPDRSDFGSSLRISWRVVLNERVSCPATCCHAHPPGRRASERTDRPGIGRPAIAARRPGWFQSRMSTREGVFDRLGRSLTEAEFRETLCHTHPPGRRASERTDRPGIGRPAAPEGKQRPTGGPASYSKAVVTLRPAGSGFRSYSLLPAASEAAGKSPVRSWARRNPRRAELTYAGIRSAPAGGALTGGRANARSPATRPRRLTKYRASVTT